MIMEIDDNKDKNQFVDNWDLVVSARVQRYLSSIGYQGDISKLILTPTILVGNPYMSTMFEWVCVDPTSKLTKEQKEEGYIKLYSYNSHFAFVVDELDCYIVQDSPSSRNGWEG
jgi:hypothetical protein